MGLVSPSAWRMPVVAAVSVWPTCAVPVMVGAPGAVLVEAVVVVSSLSEASEVPTALMAETR